MEGFGDPRQEKSLSVESTASCSVDGWKMRMWKAVQMVEACFVKFDRDAVTLPGLLCEQSVVELRSAGDEGLTVINKKSDLLKIKPLLSWDIGCWKTGVEESFVIKKRPASLR